MKQETLEEPKQKILEEVAEKKYPLTNILHLQLNTAIRTGFQEGAKWNQENILELLRSNGYDDEPIFDLINNYLKS